MIKIRDDYIIVDNFGRITKVKLASHEVAAFRRSMHPKEKLVKVGVTRRPKQQRGYEWFGMRIS